MCVCVCVCVRVCAFVRVELGCKSKSCTGSQDGVLLLDYFGTYIYLPVGRFVF